MPTNKRQPSLQLDTQRPTRDLLLLALLVDQEQGNKRTNAQLSQALARSRSSINDLLHRLAQEAPPLVSRKGKGNWSLTPEGQQYAIACRPNSFAGTGGIPHFGKIAAGEPVEMSSTPLDTFSYPGFEADEYFAMEVSGDSMLHEHIMDGDTVILRRVDGWNHVPPGAIIAAAVPQGANVDRPDWLERTYEALNSGEYDVDTIELSHITLKKIDPTTKNLVGRYGKIHTVYRPMGMLVQVIRKYR